MIIPRHLTPIILLALACSCAADRYEVVRVVNHEHLARSHPDNLVGKTEAEVIEKLGEPDFRNPNPEGGVIFVYRDASHTMTMTREHASASPTLDEHGQPVPGGATIPTAAESQSLESVHDLKVWIGDDGIVDRTERERRKAVPSGARP